MLGFQKKEISLETAADRLKKERVSKKINIEKASQDLKISVKYLNAIEQGHYAELPKGLYGKSFVKEYAFYLRLDPEAIASMYEAENVSGRNFTQDDLFTKKVPKNLSFIAVPKIAKNFFIFLSVSAILLYLGYYINNLITPPKLIILNPEKDEVIDRHNIQIKGQTELEAEITINSETILSDKDGYFEKVINLSNGLNIVSITSKKKYSRENKIIRNIIVE